MYKRINVEHAYYFKNNFAYYNLELEHAKVGSFFETKYM